MTIRLSKTAALRTAAFTLAEILVCIVMINVGAAGLMGCFKYAFAIVGLTQQNQRATQVMLERAEAIRLCSWDQVTSNGFIPSTFTEAYDPTASSGSQGVVYTGAVSLTSFPFSCSYSNSMRQLTIVLTWQSGSILRTRTNITYMAKDGIQNYVY